MPVNPPFSPPLQSPALHVQRAFPTVYISTLYSLFLMLIPLLTAQTLLPTPHPENPGSSMSPTYSLPMDFFHSQTIGKFFFLTLCLSPPRRSPSGWFLPTYEEKFLTAYTFFRFSPSVKRTAASLRGRVPSSG